MGLVGCGGSNSSSVVPGVGGSSTRVASLHYGLLADIYGLRTTPQGTTVELYQSDVMVGPNINDERESGSTVADADITYDYISSDPDTLQPRLLITREIGGQEFDDAFAALDDELRLVQPGVFGQNTVQQPFSVVARNGALRVTFTQNLGLTDDFFVERDADGTIIGVKNTEAVQLLDIVGDPTDPNGNAFKVLPVRIVPRDNVLIIDPVLLGSEGLQFQTRNNAAGMPESSNQVGANIRLAIALEGTLRIPGIRPDRSGGTVGLNNGGLQSVIRDFRSGNHDDNTPDIAAGFLRDPIPPKIAGQLVMYLEKVEALDQFTQVVTIYKNGLDHEIDRGDVIRLVIDNSGIPAAVTEVTTDPTDDLGKPSVQHVRATIRRVIQTDANGQQYDVFQRYDPSKLPGYPPTQQEREQWLVQNAPITVLVAEFTKERRDANGDLYGDDPANFIQFTPAPLPGPNGMPSPANENVSPFAGAIIRFTKPVDLSTVRSLDSYFFATRDLIDPAKIAEFQTDNGIDPDSFVYAKYVTPHLVFAQIFDEDGSQTSLRLQPKLGFYLDDVMRQADEGVAFSQKKYRYYLHVIGGTSGIRDLSGNPIDFQAEVSIVNDAVIPFSLDTRYDATGAPKFADNLSVTVARRFGATDEDEQPSYFDRSEVPNPNKQFNSKAYNLDDIFGAVVYLNGRLSGRPTSRVRQAVDDINQIPLPSQSSEQRWCPESIGNDPQVASNSAGARFGSALQNPLNPFGCRLQTVWREIDMSLSKTDPFDFNLDLEQMFWAPFTADPVVFDEFDRTSMFVGHSEFRPEPCVGSGSSLPSLPNSGLEPAFADNFVWNPDTAGSKESQSKVHTAYVNQVMQILASQTVTEVNGVYRYLPLPKFQKPYFVWRDERNPFQGGVSSAGFDSGPSRSGNYTPYIQSPFLAGQGRYVTGTTAPAFTSGFWDNRRNYQIVQQGPEAATGGLVGTIALPLLADWWVYPDDPSLPTENPFLAAGLNGWQISLALTSGAQPNFRVYSAGGLVQSQPKLVDPTTADWMNATGGYTPNGVRTKNGDNSLYWVMADFVKRISVATAGFVDIWDPHRVHTYPPTDPRLGPYFDPDPSGSGPKLPANILPVYDYAFEPPLASLLGGTNVNVEFRGAGDVDPMPWAAIENSFSTMPDWLNVPGDPRKAGDAHIRKFDDRLAQGAPRNFWTSYYMRTVTDYTTDLNALTDERFTNRYSSPNEPFLPQDVRYFNWRFIFTNNVDASPPISPTIDSFAVTYRFEKRP